MSLLKEVRDLHRFNQILLILFEEGFDYWIRKIRLKHYIPFSKRFKIKFQRKEELSNEARWRKTLERLGPTFIKFGQLLSVRPDLIPGSYIKELEKLQDRVNPVPFEDIKEAVERELGKPLRQIFPSFEKNPIASASVSQVHKAKLKNGKTVAVKVQKPNVKKLMESDIEIMFTLASLLEKYVPKSRAYNPTGIVREFSAWTQRELDFRNEAVNAKRFYRNFEGNRTVHIPKVYEEYTTPKLLVLEFIDGVELHNIRDVRKRRVNLQKVLLNGLNAVLTQVFVHGFFHADPHPGNILVLKDNSIAFIDYGIVGYFSDELKEKCIDLFYGIVEEDLDKVVDVFVALGHVEGQSLNLEAFKRDIRMAIEPLQTMELKHVQVSRVLEKVLDLALRHGFKMPLDFVLFGKTIITLEGVALQFDPEFRLVETAQPFIEKLMRQRAGPKHAIKRFMHEAQRFRQFITELPEQTRRVFRKIEEGTVKIDVEDLEIKRLGIELDRSSNRIVYGLIISASIISGALTIQVPNQQQVLGLPMLSFVSFLIALLFSLILFISILRESKTEQEV